MPKIKTTLQLRLLASIQNQPFCVGICMCLNVVRTLIETDTFKRVNSVCYAIKRPKYFMKNCSEKNPAGKGWVPWSLVRNFLLREICCVLHRSCSALSLLLPDTAANLTIKTTVLPDRKLEIIWKKDTDINKKSTKFQPFHTLQKQHFSLICCWK